MNNATNLAIAAILMVARLVVGATFSTTTTQLTAFAYQKKVGGTQDCMKIIKTTSEYPESGRKVVKTYDD